MMLGSIIPKRYKIAFACLFSFLFSVACIAEPVQQSYKGLLLNAKTNIDSTELANRRVFLIVHGTLAHNGMEIIDSLLSILQEEGEAALALTLSLNINDRKGMFSCDLKHTHHHEDAVAEIGVWLDWLTAQGASSVVLVGHSRGAAQVADYLAMNQHKRIQQAVLIAPPTASKGTPKETILMESGDLKVEQFLHCGSSIVTASSYVSYYGDPSANSTVKTIKALSLPVSVFIGSEDNVVKANEWQSVASGLPDNVQLTVIPGADHYFRDLYAYEIVEHILERDE